MLKWLVRLFCKKCPKCRSINIFERDVFTMTYNLYYQCRDCNYQWKESGL